MVFGIRGEAFLHTRSRSKDGTRYPRTKHTGTHDIHLKKIRTKIVSFYFLPWKQHHCAMQVEHEIMNDTCSPHSNQSSKERFDDNRISSPMMNLQPTPINPEKIVPVESVPIQATNWNLDTKSIEYLQGLSRSFMKAAPISIPQLQQQPESPKPSPSSSATIVTDSSNTAPLSDASLLRQKQVDQWNIRFAELVEFRKAHGHCLVPLRYEPNRSLSNWVKRQRYQYRIKQEGKHSTLNEERQTALEQLGFVWDSHSTTWEERFQELTEFKEIHGHANVPKSYKQNQPLAIWVKSRKYYYLWCVWKDLMNMLMEPLTHILVSINRRTEALSHALARKIISIDTRTNGTAQKYKLCL